MTEPIDTRIPRRKVLQGVAAAGTLITGGLAISGTGAAQTSTSSFGPVSGGSRPESTAYIRITGEASDSYVLLNPLNNCEEATYDEYTVAYLDSNCNVLPEGDSPYYDDTWYIYPQVTAGLTFSFETSSDCIGGIGHHILTRVECGEELPPGEDRVNCRHKKSGKEKELPRTAAENNPAYECDFNDDGDYED